MRQKHPILDVIKGKNHAFRPYLSIYATIMPKLQASTLYMETLFIIEDEIGPTDRNKAMNAWDIR